MIDTASPRLDHSMISIGCAVALALQTAAGAFWLGTVSGRLDNLEQFTVERREVPARLAAIELQLRQIDRRLDQRGIPE